MTQFTNLELFRRQAGLSQLEVAQKTGYSNRTISAYERGRWPNPSKKFKRKVAEALGIPIEVLFPDN